jgi:hypothetical protein
MSASIRPIDRRRAALTAGLAAAAFWLASAAQGPEAPHPAAPPLDLTAEFVFEVDLTEDLHHRLQAGLFLPEREPLVMRLTRPAPGTEFEQGLLLPAARTYLRFQWDRGTFDVRSDEHGAVVVHLDREAALSHLTAVVPPTLAGMSRDFPEYPVHPIR